MAASREEILDLAGSSIETFGRIFMPNAVYAKTPPFHKEIYRDLMDDSIKKLGIIAPRGHSKSTVTSVLYPLWRILFNPRGHDLFGIIISESQSQSMNFLGVIRHNLQNNQRILSVFGSLVGDKWTEDEIITTNNCRIVAKGTGQKIRGMMMGRETITRPNLIILDDFESETNSATPEAIDKNKSWISKAVEPSLADDGRLVAIGTIISDRAYLSTIRKDPSFKVHFYQAIMNNKPIWPERFSIKKLMDIKTSLEARGEATSFWQEYMNVPVNMDDRDFDPKWNKTFTNQFTIIDGVQPALLMPDGNYKALHTVSAVDLAISESTKADFTVPGTLGMDADGNIYIIDYERIKTSNNRKIIDAMFNQCKTHMSSVMSIETVQFQQVIANEFRRQMAERGLFVGISEEKPRTSKDARIRSLQSDFAAGRVYMRPHMTELMAELASFPNGAHDDILDMLWYARNLLHPPEIDVIEKEDSEDWWEKHVKLERHESWLTL